MCLLILVAVSFFYKNWNTREDSLFVGDIIYSPDHKYIAVLLGENGGGAISPYCFDYVSVIPKSIKIEVAKSEKFHVYAASCHSLGISHTKNGSKTIGAPLVKWKGSTELEITFDKKLASMGISHFIFTGQADEGRVKVVQGYFHQ
jgi:hypothetical protein